MVSFRGVIYISVVINVLQNRTRSHTRYTNQGVAYWYPEAYKKEFLKYKTRLRGVVAQGWSNSRRVPNVDGYFLQRNGHAQGDGPQNRDFPGIGKLQ